MKRFALGAVVVVILGVLVWLYGVQEHSRGYQKRSTEVELEKAVLLEQARKREHALLQELEEAYYDAYEQKKQADATIASLGSDVDRLRQTIATQRHQRQATTPATGIDGVSTSAWIALEECVQRYAEMAGDADRYVERLRIGQGWANALKKAH